LTDPARISPALTALAEDPELFIEPPEGSERKATEHHCLTIGPNRRWAGVCRLRLDAQRAAIEGTVAEIRRETEGTETIVWNVGSSATPADLPAWLRELGLGDPDPPLDPIATAMALSSEPPPADGVDVQLVRTLDDHVTGLEIMLRSSAWPDKAAADERSRAEATFEQRKRRGSLQWLARIRGEPVAWAAAEPAAAGLYLAGGATLPNARGKGCYRALVHARWQAAVTLGLSGLAVQSQIGTSAPILRQLGFVDVATIHTLQDR
jgi:GNAT superfamily N-acetyltransferase